MEGVDPTTIAVAVSSPCCPQCGGPLGEPHIEVATVTELPAKPTVEVRKYEVEVRQCHQCGKRVRGRHPELEDNQQGATAHRVGRRLKAAAHVLHYGMGVPVRKVPAIVKELTGAVVTQSALTQDALKQAAGPVGAAYQQLRAGVREAPAVYTDDTGWRIGGQSAFLMGFDTDQATVYQIRQRHRNEEVRELVPADYGGVLGSDRGKSYDAAALDRVEQQKCLSHLLENVSEVLATKHGRARQFGEKLKSLLRQGLQLWKEQQAGRATDFDQRTGEIEKNLTYHLRDRILQDDDNQRLLNGIGWHHDRGNVLRFLHNPVIEPTNNRAERALRPAVIARKVSHCSKNERGAETYAAFVSVVQTLKKSGRSILSGLHSLLLRGRSPTPQPA